MKRLLFSIAMLLLGTGDGVAAQCSQNYGSGVTCSISNCSSYEVYGPSGCTCMACKSGYVKKAVGTYTTTDTIYGTSCTYTRYDCAAPCTTSNCVSDTSYSSYETGKEQQVYRSCSADKSTCEAYYARRCAAGYYGTGCGSPSPTPQTITCTKCPNGGISGTCASAITQCYIPSGTAGNDTSGNFEYAGNCNYSN